MSYKKPCFMALLLLFGLFVSGVSHAQDQFSSSFNFESSSLPYNWHTSGWTTCAGECNEGNQTREVACRDNAGNAAPSEADCAHSQKPELLRTCDLPDCQWVMEDCPSHVHNSGGGSSGGSDDGGSESSYRGSDGNNYYSADEAETRGGGNEGRVEESHNVSPD